MLLASANLAGLQAAPELKRPMLHFDTSTRHPMLMGVPELPLPNQPPPALPQYFRRVTFLGERHVASGPVLGQPGICTGVYGSESATPYKRRSVAGGEVLYTYDAINDAAIRTDTAGIRSSVVYVEPWPANSCNPPPSPLPLGIPVPETAVPMSWAVSPNNPLLLPVLSPTEAADGDATSYADYIGDGFKYMPTWSYSGYRMLLSEEDTPKLAEERARVTEVKDERDHLRQSSLYGSRFDGPNWVIRDVRVQETLSSCPGDYVVVRKFQSRRIGTIAWMNMPDVYEWVTVKSDAHVITYQLRKERDYEIRLVDVTYEPITGNCAACADGGAAIGGMGPAPVTGSIAWNLALGSTASGRRAGVLKIYAPVFTGALYSPAAIQAVVGAESSVVRTGDGTVRQVLAPFELADIVVTGPESYEIRFYDRIAVSGPDGDGLYTPSGTPYVSWRVDNPAPGTSGRWRVTRIADGQSVATEVDETMPGRQVFTEASGLRVTETIRSTNGSDRDETITVRNAAGEIASKRRITYRSFAWGEEKIREILDPDVAAVTTEWTFDASAAGAAVGRPTALRQPDGFGQAMVYDGASGQLISHTNAVWSSGSTETRVERRLADLDGDGATDVLTTEYRGVAPGTQFGAQHTVEWGGRGSRDRFQVVVPGATWDAGTNIATRERYYPEGPFEGELSYRLNPDGTLLLRRLSLATDGGRIATEEQGAADPTHESVLDGMRTVRTYSKRGELMSTQTFDIATGLALQATTVLAVDAFGRATQIVSPDGAIESRTYCDTCGGLESITVHGQVTRFTYDALGRKITESTSVAGVVATQTRFVYDAEGRMLRQVRVDPANGSETILASAAYDPAGRVVSEFTLGRGTTTYAYAFAPGNLTITTTTFADGGTRIDTRAASGSIVSVRGTAVPHVDYTWTPREWWGGGIGYIAGTRRLNDDGSSANEDQSINFLGKVEHVTFGDGARAYRYYDSIGRLNREVDADGVGTLYSYDARGRSSLVAVDMNRNGVIDFTGVDRIMRTVESSAQRDGITVQRTIRQIWPTDGQELPVEIARSETSADGLRSWETAYGLTTATVTTLDSQGGGFVMTTAADGTISEQRFVAGRLMAAETRHPVTGILSSTTYEYDSANRVRLSNDARLGATHFTYDEADRVQTITTPDPDPTRTGEGYDPQVTRYGYDAMGRVTTLTQPDLTVTHTEFDVTGAVRRTWGSRSFPVEYAYDRQGRLKTMTTWQDFAADSGRAVTIWQYDNVRGFLSRKTYADGRGPSYSYTAAGRLRTRTWARGITTTYGYDNAGEPALIDYADSTPDVTLGYDRLGRVVNMTDGGGETRFAFDGVSPRLAAESHPSGALAGAGLSWSFDALQRLASVTTPLGESIRYEYDPASRLQTVTRGPESTTYGYAPGSALVASIAHARGGVTRLVTTKAYDGLERLTSIAHTPSLATPLSSEYWYNAANQRTRLIHEDGRYWSYGYDALGQVTSGAKFAGDAAPVPGLRYALTYDDIGNRRTASGPSSAASPAGKEEYTTNMLNQYVRRTVPGQIGVLGAAAIDARIAVIAGGSATLAERQGEHYFGQVVVPNATSPTNPMLTVAAVRSAAGPAGEDVAAVSTRSVFVPRSPEEFAYDSDGNLISDASWIYTWDAENRLIGVETSAARRAFSVPRQKLEYAYDGRSRRVQKRVTRYAPGGLSNELEEFFTNGTLTGSPGWVQHDGTVDGFWTAEPAPGFPGDDWSYRVTATLRVPASGEWTLTAVHRGDDGMRLYLDGQLVLDRWSSQNQGPSVKLTLDAGREYAMRYEFHDTGSWAQSQLRWSGPGIADQVVPNAANTAYLPVTSETRFLYDGWNLLAELNAANAPVRTYVWGLDLSGTLAGAGGVGGLLSVTDGGSATPHFAGHDANGNVIALVNAADGSISARYEYNPFGEIVRSEGPMAEANPIRFSTKYAEPETGQVYYGNRWYEPRSGRWIERDTMEEAGGRNLYAFCGNDPIGRIDPFGLWSPVAHDYLLDYAFRTRRDITPGAIAIMQMASRTFDDRTAVGVSFANMHSMRNEWQTTEEAKERRDAFIMRRINRAKELRKACRDKEAYEVLGQAFHAVMDSTSPEHENIWADPKVYRGIRDLRGHSAGQEHLIGRLPILRGNEDAKDLTRSIYYRTAVKLNYYYNLYLID